MHGTEWLSQFNERLLQRGWGSMQLKFNLSEHHVTSFCIDATLTAHFPEANLFEVSRAMSLT